MDGCDDIVSFAKNYLAVGFKLDYVNGDGDISNYIPDFFVKVSDREVYIVETKGREEIDLPLKMARLKQWCEDINQAQQDVRYDFVYVDEESYRRFRPRSFADVITAFRGYKTDGSGLP